MSSAKAATLAAALAVAASAAFAAQTFPPPPVASYQITCRLDADKKTVEGTEVLTWKNTTSRPAKTLRFHLYLNAFRNTLSTFWKESRGETRGGKHLPETRMLLLHLARLLDEGDGAAIDVLEQSATVLAASLGVEVFQEVTEAAHQFDFEAALATLQAAMA